MHYVVGLSRRSSHQNNSITTEADGSILIPPIHLMKVYIVGQDE